MRRSYFIAYNDLFSTWLKMGSSFDVANVRDALSAFSRLINPTHKKVFEGIFYTLQTGLSKLGDIRCFVEHTLQSQDHPRLQLTDPHLRNHFL